MVKENNYKRIFTMSFSEEEISLLKELIQKQKVRNEEIQRYEEWNEKMTTVSKLNGILLGVSILILTVSFTTIGVYFNVQF